MPDTKRPDSKLPDPDLTDPNATDYAAEAVNMTDEELIDTWQTASDEETENLSPLLRAVVDEMARRGIPL